MKLDFASYVVFLVLKTWNLLCSHTASSL